METNEEIKGEVGKEFPTGEVPLTDQLGTIPLEAVYVWKDDSPMPGTRHQMPVGLIAHQAMDEIARLQQDNILLSEELRNLKAVSIYADPDAT